MNIFKYENVSIYSIYKIMYSTEQVVLWVKSSFKIFKCLFEIFFVSKFYELISYKLYIGARKDIW